MNPRRRRHRRIRRMLRRHPERAAEVLGQRSLVEAWQRAAGPVALEQAVIEPATRAAIKKYQAEHKPKGKRA